MRTLALTALLALAACSSEDDDPLTYPPVETRYQITEAGPECRGTVDETGTPEEGPFTRYTCVWERVTVAGVPSCVALAFFSRVTADAPWTLGGVARSSATTCN